MWELMTMPWQAERHHQAGQRTGRPGHSHLRAVLACEAVLDELPLVVDGTRRPSAAMADHLRACWRCRAEMSSYERLLATLRSLRDETLDLPAGVFAAGPYIVERLVTDRSSVSRRSPAPSWALAGALALALVSTGALLLARRAGTAALGA